MLVRAPPKKKKRVSEMKANKPDIEVPASKTIDKLRKQLQKAEAQIEKLQKKDSSVIIKKKSKLIGAALTKKLWNEPDMKAAARNAWVSSFCTSEEEEEFEAEDWKP